MARAMMYTDPEIVAIRKKLEAALAWVTVQYNPIDRYCLVSCTTFTEEALRLLHALMEDTTHAQ